MPEILPKLEWTGERYLPWIRNAALAYEHLHRYAFAAQFARDRKVLDLGSGEGYGSNILAQTASSVLGVDIDPLAIQHATAKYQKDNLNFDVGSFSHVPVSEDGSFDLVVCFEAIEHVVNHDQLLAEVKRVLKPDGLFVASTPNKSAYHKESEEDNPYHLNELEPGEFQALLSRYFRESRLFGQRIHPGSTIWPLENGTPGSVAELTVARDNEEFDFVANDRRVPIYIVALASNSASALTSASSVLIDSSNELLVEREQTIRQLLATRESMDEIAFLQKELDLQRLQFDEATQSLQKLNLDLGATKTRLHDATTELELVYSSNSWKLMHQLCRLRDALLPPGSIRRRLLQKSLALKSGQPK